MEDGTMSLGEIQEILDDYRFWDGMLRRKEREIKNLRERKTAIKTIIDDTPSGDAYTLEDYIADLDELEQDKAVFLQKRTDAYRRIQALLQMLDSEKQVEVMTRHYIKLQSWGRISREIGISQRNVRRLHDRAMGALSKMKDNHQFL